MQNINGTYLPLLHLLTFSIAYPIPHAAVHLLNDGMSVLAFYDLLITGIFFSLIVYYFDSLWMAMGIHTTWNFTQSILLGLPNSGTSFPYSVFVLENSVSQPSFAYNTEFGLEGTILSSIIMTVCCIGLFYWKNHSNFKESMESDEQKSHQVTVKDKIARQIEVQ